MPWLQQETTYLCVSLDWGQDREGRVEFVMQQVFEEEAG